MKRQIALLVLLGVALAGVVSPLLGATAECAGEDQGDCCDLACALCLCCTHVPTSHLPTLPGNGGDPAPGRLAEAAPIPPPAVDPRDVLHVPKLPAWA